ncbi:MAG: GumC family protein [Xanthobacteraceae bacterium]
MQTGVQWDAQRGGTQGGTAAPEIDLGALGRALWRKKLVIAALTLLAGAIAFAAVNLITPRYKSEARVMIETRENIFFRPDAEKTVERGTTVDQEAVTSQVQLILSRDLALEVIKKLKLRELAEFDPVLAGPSLLRTILSTVGLIRNPLDMTPEERVFKSYYERLSAFQVEKSRVIAIEFESQDPELAAQAANTIAENYLLLQQASKQEQTRAAGAWLSGEIERLRTNLAQAESRVEQYRAKTNLFVGTNNTTLSNQQLGDFNAQVAAARAQKSDSETKARLIREALKAGLPIEFSDMANSELMRRLSEQRVTLRGQLAEQSSTLLDRHPRIKELKAQVADLDRQMRVEADRLARSLESDAVLASAKVDALSSALDQLKRQAASTNEQDVQLRALEREAKAQRDLLESYLAKFREATARDSIGAAAPDARIISAAVVSNTPSWPKKLATVLVAALATLVLACGFILSSELLAGAPGEWAYAAAWPAASRRSAGSQETKGMAAFGALDEARRSGVPLDAIDALAEELISSGETGRHVTVVGAVHDAGTSMTAIALARSLSRTSRVVLVELDLLAPTLSIVASEPSAPGLLDLVQGSVSFGDIITRDRYSRVHLVMLGHGRVDASAVLASPRLSTVLEALSRSYDHVLIEAGSMENAALERLAVLAPRAVLVASALDDGATQGARERLLEMGFVKVNVLAARANPHAGQSAKAAA